MRLIVLNTVLIVILFLVPCLALAADTSNHDESLKQLKEIESRLEKAISAMEQKKTAELDLLDELDDVDRMLLSKQQKVKRSNRQLVKLESEITSQKKDLDQKQKAVDQLKGRVEQRLISLYQSEDAGALKTLFSANSPSQILEDYDFLGRIVRQDRQLLEDYRQRLKNRQQSIDRLSLSRKHQQSLLTSLKRDEKGLQQAKKMKERFLSSVRRDRDALAKMVEELRQRAARLTSLVKGLESGRGGEYTDKTALFPLQKGLLPWPVHGSVKVGFGTKRHPELGTMIESHGIEILADPETPIKAVWQGRVAFAKRFQGYGNLMIIDHDDGYYTLYAQASKLLKNVGDQVKQGEAIAISGYNGADFVYFEIRNGSTPLDPSGWIARR